MATNVPWKTVWITGASSGIGREVALLLANEGARVAASARSADALAELGSTSSAILPYPLDVTDKKAAAETVGEIEASIGPIDLAILNAGVWHPMGATDFDADKLENSLDVNVLGLANALAALLPRMIARGRGHVALVSSVAGYRGLPNAAAYAASKAAAISMAESLYPDLARYGVKLSIINPGFVDTPMTRVNKFPMPFIIPADDAARRIVAGLRKGKFEIAFPWQLVTMLKIARLLPYPLYFWYVHNFVLPAPPADKK